MRYLLVTLTVFYSLLFISCSGDGKAGSNKDTTIIEKAVFPTNIQKGGEFKSVQEIRNQANAMIDFRIDKNPEPLSMITHGYWSPEFVYNKGRMSGEGEYAGFWIDFEENFTYKYGYYDQVQGKGRYHLRLDDNALLMLDDDESMEPKMWTANNNGDAMALIGRHDFGVNNGMQMKMIPLDLQPSKK